MTNGQRDLTRRDIERRDRGIAMGDKQIYWVRYVIDSETGLTVTEYFNTGRQAFIRVDELMAKKPKRIRRPKKK